MSISFEYCQDSNHGVIIMQSNKTCTIVEQYLAYLITVKGRSQNTILEYRLDLLQFFRYIADIRGLLSPDFSFANLEFIQTIQLADIYAFLAYCQVTLNGARYQIPKNCFHSTILEVPQNKSTLVLK